MDDAQLRFRPELVADGVFIAPHAVVLGDVTIGAQASIWFHAVVRGDTERIVIGARTNIQDQCVLHADPGYPCVLGDDVTVGHGAIVHGATIGNGAMIGMRAVVMNGAKIGEGSIVGVGAIVVEGLEVPPFSVVMGTPARVKRVIEPRDRERTMHAARHYVEAAARYAAVYGGRPQATGPRLQAPGLRNRKWE